MIPEEAMTVLIDGLKAIKEHAWYDHKVRDTGTHVTLIGHSGPVTIPDSVIDGLASNGGGLPYVLSRIRASVDSHWKGERPEAAVVGLEALVRDVSGVAEFEYEEGDMAKDLATDPASGVLNAIVVMVASDNLVGGGEAQTASRAYRYSDGGVIDWEETVFDLCPKGRMADELESFFQREDA
jgi:hypothetical protein